LLRSSLLLIFPATCPGLSYGIRGSSFSSLRRHLFSYFHGHTPPPSPPRSVSPVRTTIPRFRPNPFPEVALGAPRLIFSPIAPFSEHSPAQPSPCLVANLQGMAVTFRATIPLYPQLLWAPLRLRSFLQIILSLPFSDLTPPFPPPRPVFFPFYYEDLSVGLHVLQSCLYPRHSRKLFRSLLVSGKARPPPSCPGWDHLGRNHRAFPLLFFVFIGETGASAFFPVHNPFPGLVHPSPLGLPPSSLSPSSLFRLIRRSPIPKLICPPLQALRPFPISGFPSNPFFSAFIGIPPVPELCFPHWVGALPFAARRFPPRLSIPMPPISSFSQLPIWVFLLSEKKCFAPLAFLLSVSPSGY